MSNLADGRWRHAWTTDNDDDTRTYELPNGLELRPGDTFLDLDRQFCITVTDVCSRLAETETGAVRAKGDYVHFVSDWPADAPQVERRGNLTVAIFAERLEAGRYIPHLNNGPRSQ